MSPCDHPRTSVIVPARNADKTLAETLDSLLAQSDSDWEALIIDDGSTDDDCGRHPAIHAAGWSVCGPSGAGRRCLGRA